MWAESVLLFPFFAHHDGGPGTIHYSFTTVSLRGHCLRQRLRYLSLFVLALIPKAPQSMLQNYFAIPAGKIVTFRKLVALH